LVFATVSSCLTFAVGPRLIDSEHSPEPDTDKNESDDEDVIRSVEAGEVQPAESEHTHLLVDSQIPQSSSRRPSAFFLSQSQDASPNPVGFDRRPSLIPKNKWKSLGGRAKWWLLFFYDFLNAPLIGAVLGAIIGMVPLIKRAFFNDTFDGGIFSAWLTPSLKNIGSIFVPLPVIVAGVSLYLSMQKAKGNGTHGTTPWLTTIFILVIRFVLWPVISIGTIYLLAKKTDLLSEDPMLWFTMMLMPTGPSAMKLIAMVEVSGASEEDEQKIAKLLTVSCPDLKISINLYTFADLCQVSYVISPILAFTVVGSLRASEAAISY